MTDVETVGMTLCFFTISDTELIKYCARHWCITEVVSVTHREHKTVNKQP